MRSCARSARAPLCAPPSRPHRAFVPRCAQRSPRDPLGAAIYAQSAAVMSFYGTHRSVPTLASLLRPVEYHAQVRAEPAHRLCVPRAAPSSSLPLSHTHHTDTDTHTHTPHQLATLALLLAVGLCSTSPSTAVRAARTTCARCATPASTTTLSSTCASRPPGPAIARRRSRAWRHRPRSRQR